MYLDVSGCAHRLALRRSHWQPARRLSCSASRYPGKSTGNLQVSGAITAPIVAPLAGILTGKAGKEGESEATEVMAQHAQSCMLYRYFCTPQGTGKGKMRVIVIGGDE